MADSAVDYSTIPTEDLEALKARDYAKVSTKTLEYLKAHSPKSGGLVAGAPEQQEIKQTEPWYTEAIRPTLQYSGLAAGATAGAALGAGAGTAVEPGGGTAAGAVAGGIRGAGLGYSMGGQLADIVREHLGWKKPEPLKERGTRAAYDVGTGMIIQGTGELGGAFLSGAAKEISPELAETRELFKKFKIKPLPSEISPSRTKTMIEGVLSYTPASGDVFYKRSLERIAQNDKLMEQLIDKKAPKDTLEYVGHLIKRDARAVLEKYSNKKADEIQGMVDGLIQRYGIATKSEAGQTFSEIMESNRMGRKMDIKQLEADLQETLPQKGADKITISPETIDAMRKLRKSELAKIPPLRNDKVLDVLNAYLPKKGKLPDNLAKLIQKNPQILEKDPKLKVIVDQYESGKPVVRTWEGLRQDRSELLDMESSIYAKEHQGTKESHVWDAVAKRLDAEMEGYAEKQGEPIWQKYQAAREATRTMHEIYDKDLLKIMNKKPEEIVDSIIRGGEKGLTTLRQIKDAVGESGIVPLRQGFFKKQLNDATVNGVLSPERLAKGMAKIGDDMKAELLTPGQRSMLDRIANRGIEINQKVGRHTIDFLESVAGTSNEKIVEQLLKPENIQNVRLLKRFFPEKVDQVTSSFLENQIFKRGGAGNMMPVSSSKNFYRYQTVLKELMPPERFKDLSDFLKMGRYSTHIEKLAENASQTGQILIGHGLMRRFFTGLGQIATGQLKSGITTEAKLAGELTLGKVLAKIYTSDLAARYFTSAMKLSPDNPEAISNFIKAISVLEVSEEPGAKQAGQTAPVPEPRQEGGPVQPGKPYVVGEKGPEVIVPQQAGTVVPNQGAGQPAAKAPPANEFSPFLRASIMVNGQHFDGDPGDTHVDILLEKGLKDGERGFVTPDGQFLNRTQGKEYLKKNMPDVYKEWVKINEEGEHGELHIQDLMKAVDKVKRRNKEK
jgi:hypothetical protein